jgi:hypothetical protein
MILQAKCDYCESSIAPSDLAAAELPPVPGIVPTPLGKHACPDCRPLVLAGLELYAEKQAGRAREAATAVDALLTAWVREHPPEEAPVGEKDRLATARESLDARMLVDLAVKSADKPVSDEERST